MTDDILEEILIELKGLRQESIETKIELKGLRQESINTNQRIDETNNELKGLRQESINTNQRLDTLDKNVNKRIDETNKQLNILTNDVKVLIISTNETREGIRLLREIVSSHVIWQNDSIAIDTTEGATIKGTIHKV